MTLNRIEPAAARRTLSHNAYPHCLEGCIHPHIHSVRSIGIFDGVPNAGTSHEYGSRTNVTRCCPRKCRSAWRDRCLRGLGELRFPIHPHTLAVSHADDHPLRLVIFRPISIDLPCPEWSNRSKLYLGFANYHPCHRSRGRSSSALIQVVGRM